MIDLALDLLIRLLKYQTCLLNERPMSADNYSLNSIAMNYLLLTNCRLVAKRCLAYLLYYMMMGPVMEWRPLDDYLMYTNYRVHPRREMNFSLLGVGDMQGKKF